MTKNKSVFLCFLSLALLFQSCKGEDIYFQEFESIADSEWDMNAPVSFEFEVKDTNSLYDFFFNLRNTNDYGYANLYVFWELKSPDGRIKTDTSQFILAGPNGRWLSKSISGTVIENSMLFLRKKLPVKGVYSFSFKQGMREERLAEVKDVGLKIKRYNE